MANKAINEANGAKNNLDNTDRNISPTLEKISTFKDKINKITADNIGTGRDVTRATGQGKVTYQRR